MEKEHVWTCLNLELWRVRWHKCSICPNQNKMVGGKAGNVISKLCTGQATKKGLVNRSAEPLGAHWDEEMTNKWNTETKHVRTFSNSKIQKWTGNNAVMLKPRQNCWSRGRYYILSTDIMANDGGGWQCEMRCGVDGLPFWSLVSSSEANTSDMLIFWVWARIALLFCNDNITLLCFTKAMVSYAGTSEKIWLVLFFRWFLWLL